MVIEARNYTKIRVLLLLQQRLDWVEHQGFGGATAWLCPAEIANNTGVNVASLYTILKRWRSAKWGYTDALYFTDMQMADGRPHWLYKINAKGLSYLKRLHKWYKPLDAVMAVYKAYEEEHWDDNPPSDAEPRYIAWHVKPAQMATALCWPFETYHDAHAVFGYGSSYVVKDIDEAVRMAKLVFRKTPSAKCLEMALAMQNKYVKEALDKLATGAGFATTER